MHPSALEQRAEANDCTLRIYLDDAPGGHGWIKFDLYYISEGRERLNLQDHWTTAQ